jgi:quinoprotein glucose dehydrogenase
MLRLVLLSLALPFAPLPAQVDILEAFEGDGFGTWTVEGGGFGLAPVPGRLQGVNGFFSGFAGGAHACSAHGGDAGTGSLTSPEFAVTRPHLAFLIAGGDHRGETCVQLLVDGKVVREATGARTLEFRQVNWDVSEFRGRRAVLRILDRRTDGWGIIAADHFVLSERPEPPLPRDGTGRLPAVAALAKVPGEGSAAIPADAEFRVVATRREHGVAAPTALAFGNDGTLFVSETPRFRKGVEDDRDNLFWYLDDLAAATTDDRIALHRKWDHRRPFAEFTERSEIVRRLDQRGPDGAFGRARVFADGFNDVLDGTAAGVFAWDDTVYFACIPHVWMLRDGGPEGRSAERRSAQDGFGVRVSFSGHDLNGFALGPDGRLYGTLGDRGFNGVTKDGRRLDHRNRGFIFRMEPDGSGFEVVHDGLRNPKEIAFDAHGHALTVDNNSDQGDAARVVQVVDGADSGWEMEHQTLHTFHRQVGLETRPPSRWMDEKQWHLANPDQPAFLLPPVAHVTSGPSGLAYNPGAGFLASEVGRFAICDYRGSASGSGIVSFAVEPAGAGLRVTDHRPLVWGVAATDVDYDWQGRLVITDFIGGWATHDNGRVLQVAARSPHRAADIAGVPDLIRAGFARRPSAELAALLAHADLRVRLRAQLELTRRPDGAERLAAATRSRDTLERLHGVWGLGILARRGPALQPADAWKAQPTPAAPEAVRAAAARRLLPLLRDTETVVRAQAVRALGESPLKPAEIGLAALLADASPAVRREAAIAAARLGDPSALPAVVAMVRANADRDPTLRAVGAFALSRLLLSPESVDRVAADASPAVRLATVVALRLRGDAGVARFLRDPDTRVADEAIRAIGDRYLDEARPRVAELLDDRASRAWKPFMLRRVVHSAFRAGGEANARRLLAVAADTSVPAPVRSEALRLLGTWTQPHPVDQLTGHWAPLPARDAAEVRTPLAAALPALLKGDSDTLRASLALVESLRPDVSSLPDSLLLDLAGNAALGGPTRAKALELWLARKPANLSEVAHRLAKDRDDSVAMVAIGQLALLNPAEGLAELDAATRAPSVLRRQGAWKALARLEAPGVDQLLVAALADLAKAGGVSPVALELMEAAAARGEPAVAKALADLNAGLASAGPLGKWMPALEGGDPANGFALFQALPAGQCLRCHKASDAAHAAGGEAGPNLAGIARRADRRELLESVILPGAKVAPGYGVVSLTLTNGTSLVGTLLREEAGHVDLDVAGARWRVSRGDIRSLTPPVSGMPPMEYLLKPGEVRDLVAWLATLEKAGSPAPYIAPKPYVLSK